MMNYPRCMRDALPARMRNGASFRVRFCNWWRVCRGGLSCVWFQRGNGRVQFGQRFNGVLLRFQRVRWCCHFHQAASNKYIHRFGGQWRAADHAYFQRVLGALICHNSFVHLRQPLHWITAHAARAVTATSAHQSVSNNYIFALAGIGTRGIGQRFVRHDHAIDRRILRQLFAHHLLIGGLEIFGAINFKCRGALRAVKATLAAIQAGIFWIIEYLYHGRRAQWLQAHGTCAQRPCATNSCWRLRHVVAQCKYKSQRARNQQGNFLHIHAAS